MSDICRGDEREATRDHDPVSAEVGELDFTIEELEDGEWTVWTPDCGTGAIIGSGPTRNAAMESAIRALQKTAERIAFRLSANEK